MAKRKAIYSNIYKKDDINIIHWALKEKGLDAETTRISPNHYEVTVFKKRR